MKKIFLLLLLLINTVCGAQLQTVKAQYDISYAIFGKIGRADAALELNQGKYHILIQAKATGVAKLMSNRRIETYESRGFVTKEGLLPLLFTVRTRKGSHFEEVHSFQFNHIKKRILEVADIAADSIKEHTEKYLDFYAKDDILTLFFNLHFYMQNRYCLGKKCTLVAVGANEKDGKVDILPHGEELKVILHRRIFASKQGEMYVHLNRRGICDRAQLKDVVFFGDVKAKATKITYQK